MQWHQLVFLECAGTHTYCYHLNAQSSHPAATVDSMHAASLGHALRESAGSCCNTISFKWSKKYGAQANERAL